MRKGVEGLPLKYIVMILAAAIIIAVLLQITGILSSTATTGTEQANQTLNTILEKSLGNVLERSG